MTKTKIIFSEVPKKQKKTKKTKIKYRDIDISSSIMEVISFYMFV